MTASDIDPNALPFDIDAVLAGLRSWVECESPTWNAGAVNQMMNLASRELALMGARLDRIPGRMGFGDCVRATLPHAGTGPGILVPTRNATLFRWCLENGLRIVQPATLMTTGLYNEPAGAWLPSILF